MTQIENSILQGTPDVHGVASGTLLSSSTELSFWGGVDPATGEVIDRFHPLSGRLLKDTVLAIPGGRGSCTGSAVMMELLLNGLGPRALVFERREDIITFGIIVGEEFFQKTAPVVVLGPVGFKTVLGWDGQVVYIHGDRVSNMPLAVPVDEVGKAPIAEAPTVSVSDFDREALSGTHGEATRLAMKILIRTASLMGARDLMSVRQCHIDGAWYGPGSVSFGLRLRDMGGRFRVPATINALTVDQKRWRDLGVDDGFGTACEDLAKAFVDMGGSVSFTCAPYLLDSAPRLGDAVAWGESNAVAYANSVLGARTMKNANMLEALIALTGRAPRAGVYLDKNRLASVWIRAPAADGADDSFWPVLGYAVGAVAVNRIPVITGLEHSKPISDDLKAFAAAFATSSSAPMFHMVNVTPEAPTLEAACAKGALPERVDIDREALWACWQEFNHGSSSRKVDLVTLGNPHFSLLEMKKLASLCRGRTKSASVHVMVTCGRAQHALATQAGYVEELEAFGVRFLTDACWCSIRDPVIPKKARVIMTNSGKYVHYGPGLTGREFCFGSLDMCVEAACEGRSTGGAPGWLQMGTG